MPDNKLTKPAGKITPKGEEYAEQVLKGIQEDDHRVHNPGSYGRFMGQHKSRSMDVRTLEESR